MMGKIMTAAAGRLLAKSLGGTAAGPAGALIGAAVPVVLPRVARRLGPTGMIAAALGGLLFSRYAARRKERKKAEAYMAANRTPTALPAPHHRTAPGVTPAAQKQ